MTDDEMKRQIKRAKRFNYTVFAIFMIIAVLIGIGVIRYKVRHEFSPSKWAANPSERVEIVDDMLAENELTGMTKTEVTDLLGEASEGSDASNEDGPMTYYLGVESGLTSDGEWLVVYFENGLVSDYEVTFG